MRYAPAFTLAGIASDDTRTDLLVDMLVDADLGAKASAMSGKEQAAWERDSLHNERLALTEDIRSCEEWLDGAIDRAGSQGIQEQGAWRWLPAPYHHAED